LSRRVEARRRLHMERMAYRSVRARRARREAGSAASVRNAEAP
jgi:hypothetical protein